MTGQILANLLLEMDVLNIPQLKREVRKLGAHISDPLAQRWFMRAVTYWMVNIDKLMATPYKATAEPRKLRGASGHYLGTAREEVPNSVMLWQKRPPENPAFKTCSNCQGTGLVGDALCPNCEGEGKIPYQFKTGLEDTTQSTLMVPAAEYSPKQGKRTGAAIYTCLQCKGKGTLADGNGCPACHSTGRVRKEGAEATIADPNLLYIEVFSNPNAKAKYRHNPREGHFYESMALARSLLDEAEPLNPEPGTPGEGEWISRFHEPDIEKHWKQSFTPFKPSQAKTLGKTQYGEPPPKERLPSYATGEQEFYHFNPIQVRRREFFQRLLWLVYYFNYKHTLSKRILDKDAYATALASAKAESPESAEALVKEQQDAKDAGQFLKFIGGQKPEDADFLRKVMREAEQFQRDVVERPDLFTRDAETIAKEGIYKIIKVTTVPMAMKMSGRTCPPWRDYSGRTRTEPAWCTHMEGHAKTYIERDGTPLYFIDKNDQPYVLLHFNDEHSDQCKDLADVEITASTAKELAPVCARNKTLRDELLNAGPHPSGTGLLAAAVRKLTAGT